MQVTLPNQGDVCTNYDFEEKKNFSVFPSTQGVPHNNHIVVVVIALKQVNTPEFRAYILQVKKNAQALASAMQRTQCKLVTGGNDNHLLIWDLSPLGITGNDRSYC